MILIVLADWVFLILDMFCHVSSNHACIFVCFLLWYFVVEDGVRTALEKQRLLSHLHYILLEDMYIVCSTRDFRVSAEEYNYDNLEPKHCYMVLAMKIINDVQ